MGCLSKLNDLVICIVHNQSRIYRGREALNFSSFTQVKVNKNIGNVFEIKKMFLYHLNSQIFKMSL